MSDVVFVDVLQGACHLVCKFYAPFEIDLFIGVVEKMLQISGAHEFHDDTGLVFKALCHVCSQDSDNIRVTEGQNLLMQLRLKALHRSLFVASIGVKFLQRDLAVVIHRLKYGAKPTRAQQANDFDLFDVDSRY